MLSGPSRHIGASTGHYRWYAAVAFSGLKGEGEFDISAAQIHGWGLAQGKVGPEDVVEGFFIGSDPFAPAVTPTPTPIPTPPTPSPGHVTLVILSLGSAARLSSTINITTSRATRTFFWNFSPGLMTLNS